VVSPVKFLATAIDMSRPVDLVARLASLALTIACAACSTPCAAQDPSAVVANRAAAVPGSPLKYSRDIRPLLSNACFSCHGVDEASRKSGLRLDVADRAYAPADSGERAIVPGQVEDSELVRRILSNDPSEVMPPPDSRKTLSSEERERLRQWIAQGAPYEEHWSFVAPVKKVLPRVTDEQAGWAINEIDRFIAERLGQQGISPSPQAGRLALLRRVSLDLTGLPPTLSEVDRFLHDESADAYERLVDRLLASPAFGERMGQIWLDLARYADTNGYNNDEERTMWLWREWVIDAFNANQPMDQFIVDQIAGDLLPNATPEQKLATGFNRNHVITTEGGIFPEEYRVEYVADRVHTTSTVFLGLSLQCARCHDHKYDPFTQVDYYRLFAFFNNVQDKTVGYNSGAPAEPYLKILPQRWQLDQAALAARRQSAGEAVAERLQGVDERLADWEKSLTADDLARLPDDTILRFDLEESEGEQIASTRDSTIEGRIVGAIQRVDGHSGRGLEFDGQTHVEVSGWTGFESDSPFTLSAWVFPTSNEPMAVLSRMDEGAAFRGFDFVLEGGRLGTHLIHEWPAQGLKVISKTPLALNQWHHVAATYDGKSQGAGIQLYVDGKRQEAEITNDTLTGSIQTDQPLRIGRRTSQMAFRGRLDEVELFRSSLAAEDIAALVEDRRASGALKSILALEAQDRTPSQKETLRRHYLAQVDSRYRDLVSARQQAEQALASLEGKIPATMVMQELADSRGSFVLKRGQYDQPGDAVTAGVPAALPGLSEGVPGNRLGLAYWLVDRRNPLTARVMVNRWWYLLFGTGLVETVEDFGLQGAYPSHPDLLDWLAVDFQESQWDLKRLLKQIVLSATYRQRSEASPQQVERDPRNQWLGRGARYRLSAETIRDSALSVAGLLNTRLGGASVKPYQPAGIWQDVSVERRAVYEPSKGGDLYRRSLYTFWKRTCPPPSMISLDAPDRETCTIRRGRTNTPLQALVLLNDPTYVESARTLAMESMEHGGESDQERLVWLWKRILARIPRPDELDLMLPLLAEGRTLFAGEPARADLLLKVGDSAVPSGIPAPELASWTTMASVLLNLDEFLSRE
jgi:hypothetical protein